MNALLERKHNVGMQFASGWVFGQVVNYEDVPVPFDRYSPVPANSGLATIAGTTNYWFEWVNAQNQVILRERDMDKILQAFVGIYPANLRLFKQFPAPIIRGNLYEIKVPAVLTAQSGGFIRGDWSPYENPTTLTEMLIPPELHIQWGVYNDEGFAVTPRFMIFIRRLQIKYYRPNNTSGKKAIEAIIEGKMPAKLWSPGLEPYEYDVMDRIGVETYDWTPAVTMNAEEEG